MELGDFSEHTFDLGEDYEGKVIATLMESPKHDASRPSILYIHGLSDYFFQAHVAEAFHKQGFNFYALDLRKHGRSLLPHQTPNYCRSVKEYFPEIDRALEFIQSENNSEIILLGHSTGGLTGSLYLNEGENRQCIDKLILNSPFLQFNLSLWQRAILFPAARLISNFKPYASLKKPFSHLYGASISSKKHGEWDYNTDWKPLRGFPAYLKWVTAMHQAQKNLRRHSPIKIPILILHSDKSSRNQSWNENILKTDMVLNVEHIKKYGEKLGDNVTLAEVKGAMHDVFLSGAGVRKHAFEKMFSWLRNTERM
ncbi:alpha/beta hydrolase [Gracilimonas sp. BCB1]|uniref:alpha/beta hydrolase n=1 Tax=Gracilimonas sp. BCB1 TaxID=3152362 RepID=UPI0032D97649